MEQAFKQGHTKSTSAPRGGGRQTNNRIEQMVQVFVEKEEKEKSKRHVEPNRAQCFERKGSQRLAGRTHRPQVELETQGLVLQIVRA